MRFKSQPVNGYTIYAVAGTYTISFAIDYTQADNAGLLGFAVERQDLVENEKYFMAGFKVFQEIFPTPDPTTKVTTFEHPVQSFVWDDFTAKPGYDYIYTFHPIKGKPKNLDRSALPIAIHVRTEKVTAKADHDIFFNRGAASSQAYSTRFNNLAPDKQPTAEKKAEAFAWLSRGLEEGLLAFIKQAKKGDALRCCFYEFHHESVILALKAAVTKGVDVQIIIDAKKNATEFPRESNLEAIAAAQFPMEQVILREARTNSIQHNKFMVLLKGKTRKPSAVWTGSTNISTGGIFGQTNVGHCLRNTGVATKFLEYWTLLTTDPGGKTGDSSSTVLKKNKDFRAAVVAIQPDLDAQLLHTIPKGVTPIFSPRASLEMLDLYFALVDSASDLACITLAFGVNKVLKEALKNNTAEGAVTFLLLEKQDSGGLKASNNVYQAFGSFIDDALYQWTKETNTDLLNLNFHVKYIHSKFLLHNPLGADPIVVTGSANFSEASTKENDENMLVIRGSTRTADIYFTEFNRLFNHYYFRSLYEIMKKKGKLPDAASIFLAPDDSWLAKYEPGKLRAKRVNLFTKMAGLEKMLALNV